MKTKQDSLRKYADLPAGFNLFWKQLSRFVDVIWPPRSIVTGEQLAGPGLVEAHHWVKLDFLVGPKCRCCGLPFDLLHEVGDAFEEVLCGACTARQPAFDMARSALAYNEISSQIVLRLKTAGDRSGLKQMASWMRQCASDDFFDVDFIMPVPLHTSRLRMRGYNQSYWLAHTLGKNLTAKVKAHVIKRHRKTPSQAGKSAQGRKRNVAGAFQIPKRHFRRLANSKVLLIDDVFTTGATVEACALTLKSAGVEKVNVLTVARVVSAKDPTI